MSYSNLFMKSMFPKAPLRNGVGRYVCQLQRITLKFCKTHGGSHGMRYANAELKADFDSFFHCKPSCKPIFLQQIMLNLFSTA